MWEWLNATIMQFKSCFSRRTTFGWFAIILMGLMIRSDNLGISSIVRELSLQSSSYAAMLHFFRSEGWHMNGIRYCWARILSGLPILIKEAGRCILIGDGVKNPKEGRKMPGVKKLHQESGNSSKGEYIHGHSFGAIGILVGSGAKQYSILLTARLHDGIAALGKWWKWESHNEESHVVKTIRDAAWAVGQFGKSILLLDRLYLTKPMLLALAETSGLCVVTKAKSNVTAYYPPGNYKGRGARPKKGLSVKIADFFGSAAFTTASMAIYGKDKAVQYFCIDLLWGKGLYQPLRFVLTVIDGTKSILVSTDLTLSPEQIICLYCRRFKIECAFRELKQVVFGFSYHFWSKVMPKLQKFKINAVNQAAFENVCDPKQRNLIHSTIRAIEGYVQLCVIALGLLQLISLLFGNEVNQSQRFMRTVSSNTPSERTVSDFLRKNIYILFRFFPNLSLTTIIQAGQSILTKDSFDRSA